MVPRQYAALIFLSISAYALWHSIHGFGESMSPPPPPKAPPIEVDLILKDAVQFFESGGTYVEADKVDTEFVLPLLVTIAERYARKPLVGVFKNDPERVCSIFIPGVDEHLASQIAETTLNDSLESYGGDVLWRTTCQGNMQLDVLSPAEAAAIHQEQDVGP